MDSEKAITGSLTVCCLNRSTVQTLQQTNQMVAPEIRVNSLRALANGGCPWSRKSKSYETAPIQVLLTILGQIRGAHRHVM